MGLRITPSGSYKNILSASTDDTGDGSTSDGPVPCQNGLCSYARITYKNISSNPPDVMSKILINIAWPYANGPIHLGHVAGSLLPPDIFSRYNRLLKNEVWVVGGSDQHGTPITVTAEKEGVTPEEIADRYHEINKKSIEGLGIEYSLFGKTHSPVHEEITQKMFLRLKENGYIAEVSEDEYYCPRCRKFLPDRYVEGVCPKCGAKDVRSDQCDSCGTTFVPGDLLEPHCMHCGSVPEVRASKQFALKLSDFEEPLKKWISEKDYWRPNVKVFTENFLKGGLKDRSITRDMSWGVPIPVEGDEWRSKVIYVWFDAVIGYLSMTIQHSREIGRPNYWRTFWQNPECRHYYFIGKDNIPFHSIIWPAMLMGCKEDFNLPYDIPANEYLMFNGGKLSKSRKGAVTDGYSMIPRDIQSVLRYFDPEEIRYYLSVVMPDLHDSEFSWNDFETRVNNELVATLGNFYHRCLSFTYKNFGKIPEGGKPSEEVADTVKRTFGDYSAHLGGCDFKKAIQDVMALAHYGNEYFNSRTPWKLVKTDKTECGEVLRDNLFIVKALTLMAWPFMPVSSQKIWGYLGLEGTPEDAGFGTITDPLPSGTAIPEPMPVYGKVDLKVMFPQFFGQPEADVAVPEKTEPFGLFKKLDLRVGKVLKAEDHPNADKLFKLTVDVGDPEPRTICAGLKAFYTKQEMEGREAIVVYNLAPRPLRGIDSCGMLLAADDTSLGGNTVSLLQPSAEVPPGTRFDCGMGGEQAEIIDYKKDFVPVTMKVSSVKDGRFVAGNIGIELPKGSPDVVAAVIDGDRAVVLGDGKGTVATIGRRPADGAGVR